MAGLESIKTRAMGVLSLAFVFALSWVCKASAGTEDASLVLRGLTAGMSPR